MVMYDRIPSFLYHYTSLANLPGILSEGIIPSKGPSPYYKQPYHPAVPETEVWFDTTLYKLKSPNTAVVSVATKLLDVTKLKKYGMTYSKTAHWYTYHGIVPSSAIFVIEQRGPDIPHVKQAPDMTIEKLFGYYGIHGDLVLPYPYYSHPMLKKYKEVAGIHGYMNRTNHDQHPEIWVDENEVIVKYLPGYYLNKYDDELLKQGIKKVIDKQLITWYWDGPIRNVYSSRFEIAEGVII